MNYRDLHNKPFSEETITKLEIFEDYAKAWIPTFVIQKKPIILICDFFAGTGYDTNKIPGSPIRLLSKILEQNDLIRKKGSVIRILLNEFQPNTKTQKKFELLKQACKDFIGNHSALHGLVLLEYYNEDFETLFPKIIPLIKQFPALIYLDQNGIKFTSEKYFLYLERIPQTDFLYFISSSYFWRFGDTEEFKMHLDIDMEIAKSDKYNFIHVSVLEQVRKKLPLNTRLKLYPFSLKKGTNIHGIIFGATHPLAVSKFLNIGWQRNKDNGQANFDIFDNAIANQVDLFTGERKPTRIEIFKRKVRVQILTSTITNNIDLFIFSLNEGFLGSHAAESIKAMKNEGLVEFEGLSPLVTYENAFRKPKKIYYSLK